MPSIAASTVGTFHELAYENKDGRMVTAQMGKVVVTAKVENLEDLFDVEKGSIAADAVRSVEVHDALVDTEATGLLLPRSMIASLGLRPLRTRRRVGWAERSRSRCFGPCRLTIRGRDCAIDVGEIGDV